MPLERFVAVGQQTDRVTFLSNPKPEDGDQYMALDFNSRRAVLALTCLVLSNVSIARNDTLMQPVDEVMRLPSVQPLFEDAVFLFGPGVPSGFGAIPATIVDVVGRGIAKPSRAGPGGRTVTKSDPQNCREAFALAIADLRTKAREQGGNALIGIVSFYKGVQNQSTTDYECHAGITRAVVELKAGVAVLEPTRLETLQTAMGQDSERRRRAVASTRHTEIGDVAALPHVSDRMAIRYRELLSRPASRAFAVDEHGAWGLAWGTEPKEPDVPADPRDRALRACETASKHHCVLYAVDNSVVYAPTTLQIGMVSHTESSVSSDRKIDDPSLIPNATERTKAGYETFLTRPFPRVFATNGRGGWGVAWGTKPKEADAPKDPAERALQNCARATHSECVVYAIDDRVVYAPKSPE